MKHAYLKLIGFLVILLFCAAQLQAQDTIRITLPEAEKFFLRKNLSLLAAKYNIDANKALIQQAKLWDNPVLITDQNIYDGKFFRHKTENGQQYGQVYIQIQQLIRTAGKRNKSAQLATDNTTISRQQFDDVLRSLHYTLQSDFLEIAHLQKTKKVYDGEIFQVEKLVKSMEEVFKLGDISLKENMRLKALLFNLQNELVNIQTQIIPIQNEIKLLLQFSGNGFIQPVFSYQLPDLISQTLPTQDSLIIIAKRNRPDIQVTNSQLLFQKDNLIYQRSLAKPDVTIAPEYDRLSSYQPNLFGVTVSLPVNIFNKNQGNIKSAQASVKQQETLVQYQNDKVVNEVTTAIEKAKYYQSINNRDQLNFSENYQKLFENVLKSYQARQISLLDFTDFLDSYKDTKLKLIEQHNGLVKALAELNYTINQNITLF